MHNLTVRIAIDAKDARRAEKILDQILACAEDDDRLIDYEVLSQPTELSPTQQQIAELSNYTADEIAEELEMNPRTVRAHLVEIRKRLGVNTKREILPALNDRSPS
jgi:DNA-binding CsgD family transcriptional regulator